jgi:hypothetical protein
MQLSDDDIRTDWVRQGAVLTMTADDGDATDGDDADGTDGDGDGTDIAV